MSEAFRLQHLRLKRVSLVNEPAQAPAQIVLFKSKETPVKKDDGMGGDDIEASAKSRTCMKCEKALASDATICPNCGTKVPAGAKKMKVPFLDKITDPEIRKAVEKMAGDLEAAQDLAKEAEDKRVTAEKALKAATDAAVSKETEEDKILKSLPESVRKRLEKAEADAKEAKDAVVKMADERREREFITKAKVFGNLSLDPKTFGPLLKRVADGTSTEKDSEELQRVLAGANTIAKGLFRKKGSEGGDGAAGTTAMDQIMAKAKELREQVTKSGEKAISQPDAMDRVIRENPDLYKQHLRETAPTSRAATGGASEEEE